MLADRLERAFSGRIAREKLSLDGLEARLSGRNPLAVLGRGYCLVEREGTVVRSVREVSSEEKLRVRMADGRMDVVVKGVTREEKL